MFKKLAAIILPFVVCLPASAQSIPVPAEQWIPVTQSPQGAIFSIDRGTVGATGNVRSFWVNVNHAQGQSVAISRVFMAANCATNDIGFDWVIEANWQGQILVNGRSPLADTKAAPGTVNDKLVNAVCTGFSTDPQLNALTRARQSDSEAIIRAMQIGAGMHK